MLLYKSTVSTDFTFLLVLSAFCAGGSRAGVEPGHQTHLGAKQDRQADPGEEAGAS